MDIYCPICGEPWDMDCLHEVPGHDYAQAWTRFRIEGCPVFGTDHNMLTDAVSLERASMQAALQSILGDDVDAIAAELEDLGG